MSKSVQYEYQSELWILLTTKSIQKSSGIKPSLQQQAHRQNFKHLGSFLYDLLYTSSYNWRARSSQGRGSLLWGNFSPWKDLVSRVLKISTQTFMAIFISLTCLGSPFPYFWPSYTPFFFIGPRNFA